MCFCISRAFYVFSSLEISYNRIKIHSLTLQTMFHYFDMNRTKNSRWIMLQSIHLSIERWQGFRKSSIGAIMRSCLWRISPKNRPLNSSLSRQTNYEVHEDSDANYGSFIEILGFPNRIVMEFLNYIKDVYWLATRELRPRYLSPDFQRKIRSIYRSIWFMKIFKRLNSLRNNCNIEHYIC